MNITAINTATKFQSIEVNDILVDGLRIWRVTGVYLGGHNQESVVGLYPLDKDAPSRGPEIISEMLMPLCLIPPGTVYRPVNHDGAAKGFAA